MLQKLTISNYALISNISIDFKKHFTVITGETGAGKSIIFGAIELLLGTRASNKVLKNPNSKCVVEGVFLQNNKVLSKLVEMDLDVNEDLIIRREIRKNGTSRSFINDSPVKIDQLKNISQYIIEINGQHLVNKMGSLKFKYDFIDSFINDDKVLSNYQNAFINYSNAVDKQIELKKRAAILIEKKDFLNFQLDELSIYNIEQWDEEAIQNEYSIASNSEEINDLLEKINNTYDRNGGLSDSIEELKTYSNDFLSHIHNFSTINDRIKSIKIEIEDIFHEINRNFKTSSPDKNKLKELDELLKKINYLLKKFNVSDLKSLIDKKNAVAKELMEFKEMDSEIIQVDKEVLLYQSQCLTFGKQLYELRSKQVPVIEKEINSVLQSLSMGHANFKIDLNLSNEITRYGIHDSSLLISVNNTSKYYPLHQFSSGGELSRVALAMKYISSSFNNLSTLIFDEIDSGISGKVASEVGYLLKEISKTTQVINITHLPQVAAIAKYHLNVSKNDLSGEMETEINYLRKEDRIQVLAKMLGGDKTGKAALNNALELLN